MPRYACAAAHTALSASSRYDHVVAVLAASRAAFFSAWPAMVVDAGNDVGWVVWRRAR